MSAPDLAPVAERLYAVTAPLSPQDALPPAGGGAATWPLAWFCAGLGMVLQPFEDLTAPSPDGRGALGRLLDPDAAPVWALPWLGMATGTKLPQTLPAPAAREAIKQTPAQDRGTAPAIVGVARRHTSDPVAGPVTLVAPYDDSVHEALLVLYTAVVPELPAGPSSAQIAVVRDAIARDLEAVQPAWLKITIRFDPGWSVGQMEAAYGTVGDVEGHFTTIATAETELPHA